MHVLVYTVCSRCTPHAICRLTLPKPVSQEVGIVCLPVLHGVGCNADGGMLSDHSGTKLDCIKGV